MKKIKSIFNAVVAWVLIFAMSFQVVPVFAQDNSYLTLISEMMSEFSERHHIAGEEWIYTFHADGTLTIHPESQNFIISLNNDGEVFVTSIDTSVILVDGDFSFSVNSPVQSFQSSMKGASQTNTAHIITLREFNDGALEVDVLNENGEKVNSITGESVTSISVENISHYLAPQNFNNEYAFEPAAAIIVIPISVILALLATTVIFILGTMITGPTAIVGNADVRRSLENLGSGAIAMGRDLVSAVSAVFSTTLNATNINANFHLHHIVAQSSPSALPARNVLNSVTPVIGINSSTNLVPLRASFHSRLHTTAYYNAINALLHSSTGNRNSILVRMDVARVILVTASNAIPF